MGEGDDTVRLLDNGSKRRRYVREFFLIVNILFSKLHNK